MLIETNTEAAMRLLDRSEIGAPETVTPSEYRKILRKRAGIGVKPFLAIIGILILSAALMALALVVEDSSLKLIVLAALVVGILVSLYFGTRKYLSDLYFMPCYAFIKNGSRCLLNEAVADNRYPLKVRGQDVFVRVRYHVDSFNAAQSGMKAFYFERLLMLHDKRITFVAMRSDFDRDTLNAEIAFYTSIKDEKKLAEIVRSKFSPESSLRIVPDPEWKEFSSFRPDIEDVDRTFVADILGFLRRISYDPDDDVCFNCVFSFEQPDDMGRFVTDAAKNGFSRVCAEKTSSGFSVSADYSAKARRDDLLKMQTHLRSSAADHHGELLSRSIRYGDVFNSLRRRKEAHHNR